jgi:hypothetical protein
MLVSGVRQEARRREGNRDTPRISRRQRIAIAGMVVWTVADVVLLLARAANRMRSDLG